MRRIAVLTLVLSLTLLNASAISFQNEKESDGVFSEHLHTAFDISGWGERIEEFAVTLLDTANSVLGAFVDNDLVFGLAIAFQATLIALLAFNFLGFTKKERSRGKDMLREDIAAGSGTKPSEIFFIKEMR